MNPVRRFFVRLYLWYCVYILKVDKKKEKKYLGKQMWLAVNKDGQEVLIYSDSEPFRMEEGWWAPADEDSILDNDLIYLSDGYIERNLGDKLEWEDDAVEYGISL
jgi:hypothetical protein